MNDFKERNLKVLNGYAMLFGLILMTVIVILGCILGGMTIDNGGGAAGLVFMIISVLLLVLNLILYAGLHTLKPNEAYIFTLFGKYYGTVKDSGFFWTNPFASPVAPKQSRIVTSVEPVNQTKGAVNYQITFKKTVSLKVQTLVNDTQKVNDLLGNPIIIGAIVIWKVSDPTRAVFSVNDYNEYLSSQADSIIRNVARLYPYDIIDDNTEEVQTLRASANEIAERMQLELQDSVTDAGLEIIDVRLNQLSYAPEIAAAMLQRQQATAVIAARQKIVEGAVSMVKMALDQLSADEIVELDDERKAAMVSNLLVVLCGNKDAQPIVNSGSIY